MKELFTSKNTLSKLLGVTILAAILLFSNIESKAAVSVPQIPVLSLMGAGSTYDRTFYPDGVIWLPISDPASKPREFLMPVFIDNKWIRYNDTLKAMPIKSFKFKVLYDSTSLRVSGVQTFGPRHNPNDLDYQPLASNFRINWADRPDYSYYRTLKPNLSLNPPSPENANGRSVTISGISDVSLPTTDPSTEDFKVLLYIRFECVPQSQLTLGTAGYTPIHIGNDTIMYNDMNIAQQAPFRDLKTYFPSLANQFPSLFVDPSISNYNSDVQNYPGLGGPNTKGVPGASTIAPVVPGHIWVHFMSAVPQIGFQISRSIGQTIQIGQVGSSGELYSLNDPITVDEQSFSPYPSYGSRQVDILNTVPLSRISEISVESDSEWLLFQTVVKGITSKTPNPIPTLKRIGRINYIDNDILSPLATDQMGTALKDDGNVSLEIRCDPSKITTKGEKTGIYVGYLTFKSTFAQVSPVRIRVTFIYFKAPIEGQEDSPKANSILGIELNMTNAGGENTRVVFGTNTRATDGVDSLFGEFPYESDMPSSKFSARFYPYNPVDQNSNVSKYGFGDFASSDEQRKSESRDVRNLSDTLQSIIYYCKFNANGDLNYPVVIKYDVDDFPDGAQLYIRDAINGSLFNQNMRNTTQAGGTQYYFTITDPKFTSFIIEYTLPKVINYVDQNGDLIIKEGWNLLSLPVKPLNPNPRTFYPLALNLPLRWYSNGYENETVLSEGTGYFVKYRKDRDKQFAGTFISEISVAKGNAPKLFAGQKGKPGWNTIGALSGPQTLDVLDFDRDGNNQKIDRTLVRGFGVWGYNTDQGYKETSVLNPGRGYWIKVDQQGFLKMIYDPALALKSGDANNSNNTKEDAYAKSTTIEISDNAQAKTEVYLSNDKALDITNFEMPPAPIMNLFDARFENDTKLNNANESVILLQGIQYPCNIGINNSRANITLFDAVTNEELGSVKRGNSASIVISNSSVKAIKVVKTEVANSNTLFTNWPNPASVNTTFEYNLANASNVKIQIYDQVGNLVGTVVNEFKNSGNYSQVYDLNNLTSGTYICKFTAGEITTTTKLSVVK